MNLADLKSAFSSKDALTKELAEAKAKIDELTSERNEACALAASEKDRADGFEKAAAELCAQVSGYEKQLAELNGKLAALEASVKTVEQRAGDRMKEEMGKLGVPAADLPASTDPKDMQVSAKTASQWQEEVFALKDPVQRTAFFRKHKKEIMTAGRGI